MTPKQGSVVLFVCIFVGLMGAVSGDCGFPANYQNRFWFRMFSYNSNTSWIYRLLQPNAITDNQNENKTNFRITDPCQDLYLVNQSVLYYLTSNNYCAKLVITDDSSAILIQEVDVSNYVPASASQCVPLLNESCLVAVRCSAIWMPVVTQLTAPPQFSTIIPCPFQGAYQLSVDYAGSSNVCLGDGQSTATASGSSIQFNVCNQNNLRNTMFKQVVTLLTQSTVCMAQLPGDAVNTDETGSSVLLLRYQNSLFCARYKTDASGNILLAVNVRNVTSAYCGPGMASSMSASSSNSILLRLAQLPSTTSTTLLTTIPTTIPTTSTPTTTSTSASTTPSTTTAAQPSSFPPTVSSSSTVSTTTGTTTGTSTTPTTSVPTSSSTTSSTASTTASTTIASSASSTTFPSPSTSNSTNTMVNPNSPASSSQDGLATGSVTTWPIGLTSPKTGSSGGGLTGQPPVNLNGSDGNCPAGACGKGAVCNETGGCRCRTAFYRYSVDDSRCVQDDESIDDAFLKIVVPIIVVSALGSIVAGLVLCIAADPLGPGGGGGEATLGPAGRTMSLQPPPEERGRVADPVYVTYGRNQLETYANIESLDKSLVTYGNETLQKPLDTDYALVRSSIPPKIM